MTRHRAYFLAGLSSFILVALVIGFAATTGQLGFGNGASQNASAADLPVNAGPALQADGQSGTLQADQPAPTYRRESEGDRHERDSDEHRGERTSQRSGSSHEEDD